VHLPARIKDGLNLISKVTPGRAMNLLKLYGSYYWSRYTGDIRHAGRPFTVSIEPTTSCNLRCPQCPSGLRMFSRNTGKLSYPLYKKIIDDLSPELFYLILYFQGEPYMNPLFFKMVEYASSKKIYTATSTNAHFLNDRFCEETINSGLDRLIISLDGTDQETYEKYRVGGSYKKVIEGTRNLVRWKRKLGSSKPYIILQFIVFSTNEDQLDDVKRQADELGVDELQFKTAQIYDYEDGNDLIPENESFSRYLKSENGKYVINNQLNNHCRRMWRGCVFTWDGMIVPCCFDKDADNRLGDIKKYSFDEIWRGAEYRKFREKVFTNRKEIDICRNCTEK
jgi:radical SAM protein with 4Fe4S-binding SPASM domain